MSLSRPFLGDITKSDQNTVDSKKVWTVQELIDLDGIGAVKVTPTDQDYLLFATTFFLWSIISLHFKKKSIFSNIFLNNLKNIHNKRNLFFSHKERIPTLIHVPTLTNVSL
jgi:hypothetical protein